MSIYGWLVVGFLVLVVVGSAWLWRRSQQFDGYIDELHQRDPQTPLTIISHGGNS